MRPKLSLLFVLIILFAVFWLAVAFTSWLSSNQVHASTPTDNERKELLRVREIVWRAWFSNDQAQLKRLFPETTLAINAGEETWGNLKETLEEAQNFADRHGKLLKLEFPRTEIRMYGDSAIMFSKYPLETDVNGKRDVRDGRATEIFVRRNGQWLNPGWHIDSGR